MGVTRVSRMPKLGRPSAEIEQLKLSLVALHPFFFFHRSAQEGPENNMADEGYGKEWDQHPQRALNPEFAPDDAENGWGENADIQREIQGKICASRKPWLNEGDSPGQEECVCQEDGE